MSIQNKAEKKKNNKNHKILFLFSHLLTKSLSTTRKCASIYD